MKSKSLILTLSSIILSALIIAVCIGQETTNCEAVSIDNDVQKSLTEELHELTTQYSERSGFNGAILVAKGGKIVYQNGFGCANFELQVPNETNTKFRIGSISKQFTAVLIMQLVAENQLDLHTPIINYLPEFPHENGEKITIHHLLTHSSGIPNNHNTAEPKKKKPGMHIPDNFEPRDLVKAFWTHPLEFEPGERFEYCNAGYTLLGYILETVTNQSYQDLLQQRIFNPMNMKNSGFDNYRNIISNRASGYFESWGEHYNANYIDMSAAYSAGALYSTVEDLFLWNQALLSNQLLPENLMETMFEPHIPDPGYDGDYGYGWSIVNRSIGNSQEEIEVICHDGVIDGFCALSTLIPADSTSIIVLSNIRRSPLNAMTRSILGVLNQEEYDSPKISLAYSMLQEIDKSGIEKAKVFFDRFEGDDEYYISERELNIVSYRLYKSERIDEGIEVLKLGIMKFPEGWNLHDSLGELLRANGRIQESISSYKRSIELNPQNENGVRMLQELKQEVN